MTRSSKYVLWGLVGIWLVAMLALLPKFVDLHREKSAVLQEFSEYGASLVSQHFEQAYQYCGSAFREAMPYDQFVKLHRDLQEQYGPLTAVARQTYSVHGGGTPMYWKAVIDADFVYQRKTLRFEFVLHKEGERWVIFGAEQL
jgi:hypothetical protein